MRLILIQIALQQGEAGTVVTFRTGKGKHVSRITAKYQAEVIGLHFLIAGTGSGQRPGIDLRKQAVVLIIG